jgi:hypothetical protein
MERPLRFRPERGLPIEKRMERLFLGITVTSITLVAMALILIFWCDDVAHIRFRGGGFHRNRRGYGGAGAGGGGGSMIRIRHGAFPTPHSAREVALQAHNAAPSRKCWPERRWLRTEALKFPAAD